MRFHGSLLLGLGPSRFCYLVPALHCPDPHVGKKASRAICLQVLKYAHSCLAYYDTPYPTTTHHDYQWGLEFLWCPNCEFLYRVHHENPVLPYPVLPSRRSRIQQFAPEQPTAFPTS